MCQRILLVLSWKGETRFNELLRSVEKMRIATGPTFKKHIKHLTEAEYVIREEKGDQHTVFRVNESKFADGKKYIEEERKLIKSFRDAEIFFSLPITEQVNEVLRHLGTRKLFEIEARIALELDPQSFEKQFGVFFFSQPLLETPENWLIQKCVADEKYRVEVLKRINELLDSKVKGT